MHLNQHLPLKFRSAIQNKSMTFDGPKDGIRFFKKFQDFTIRYELAAN